ncbi:apyrase-like [Achroia grisella]|uniref:apyrase-like n=1 Tax=Achroia grisella TaxID=688607 RepID=UPI0027D21001|nr:apyrase-like [Achroia grisella]
MLRIFICVTLLLCVKADESLFSLNILHYNDFHARFVETSPAGGVCNPQNDPCVGGFSRLTTLVRERIAEEPNSLLLNGGDSFQGTIWFNILGWNVTQEFMNLLPHDAHVLGNHEFDKGIEEAVLYIKNLNSTVVTANIIDDEEESIQGLYKPSVVIEREGRKIGIIGVIIAITNELASTGRLKFTDEVESVKREAQNLHDKGVDIIIVLSHSGIDTDREIAANGGPHIDIIVGGHSHTFLYDGEPPDSTVLTPQGPYPVVVDNNGKKVPIVQAAAHLLYLGEIKLYFDNAGNLVEWNGKPHYIGNEIVQAEDVLAKINYYLPLIEEKANEKVGSSLVHLSSDCACNECNLGNVICDAFLNSVLEKAKGDNWHYAHFCIINQGGIRVDIEAGNVTFESVIMSTPFDNNVEVFDMRGDHILELLEYSVANTPFLGARMLQVSGLQPQFDGSQPVNSRVVSVGVRCIDCDIPKYESLQPDKYYKVVSQSFIGNGGDGFTMVSDNRINVEVVGLDYDILANYISRTSPLFSEVDGRIQIDNPCIE